MRNIKPTLPFELVGLENEDLVEDLVHFYRVYSSAASSFGLPFSVAAWATISGHNISLHSSDSCVKVEEAVSLSILLDQTHRKKLATFVGERVGALANAGSPGEINNHWKTMYSYAQLHYHRGEFKRATEIGSQALLSALNSGNARAIVECASFAGRLHWLVGNYEECLTAGRYILDNGFSDDNEYKFPWLSAPLLPLILASMEFDRMSNVTMRVSRLLQRQIDQSINPCTVLCNLILVFNMEVVAGDVFQASLRTHKFYKDTASLKGLASQYVTHTLLLAQSTHHFIIMSLEKDPKLLEPKLFDSLIGTFKNLHRKMLTDTVSAGCRIALLVTKLMVYLLGAVSDNLKVSATGASTKLLQEVTCINVVQIADKILAWPNIEHTRTLKLWALELKGRHHPDRGQRQALLREALATAVETGSKNKENHINNYFGDIIKTSQMTEASAN